MSLWFDVINMILPESENNLITEAMVRPSLLSWANALSTESVKFTAFASQLFYKTLSGHHSIDKLHVSVADQGKELEVVDAALRPDPRQIKMGAFATGTVIGRAMATPLLLDRFIAGQYALDHFNNAFLPELRRIKSKNVAQQADERADWLVLQGYKGQALFSETGLPLDNLTDGLVEEAGARLYAKAGAGVMLGLVWEGYKKAEQADMMNQLECELNAGNPAFDAAIAKFLH